MSYTVDQLLSLASSFDELSSNSLEKSAKKKEEDKKESKSKKKFPFWLMKKKPKDSNSAKDKKLDPKAKVSNKKTIVKEKKKSAYYESLLNKFAQTATTPDFANINKYISKQTPNTTGVGTRQPNITIDKPNFVPAKPQPLQYRKDVETAQNNLNNLKFTGKLNIAGLDTDGKLGNLTRAALKAYKAYMFPTYPSMTDEQAIKYLQKLPEVAVNTTEKSNEPEQTWMTPPAKVEDPGF